MIVRILFCLLLMTELALGQKNLWSTPQKITNRTYFTNIIGQNNKGIFYYQTSKSDKKRNILITSLKKDMKLRGRENFIENSKQRLEGMVLFDEWIGMIYSVRDKKTKTVQLFAKLIDADLREVVDDKLLLTQPLNDFRADIFRIISARDHSGFLLTIATSSDAINNNLKLIHFDRNCIQRGKSSLDIDLDSDFKLRRTSFVDGRFLSVLTYFHREGTLKRSKRKMIVEKKIDSSAVVLHALYGDGFVTNTGLFSYDTDAKALCFNSFYAAEDTTKPEGFYQYQVFTQVDSAKQRKLAFHPAYINELMGIRGKPKMQNLHLMKAVKRSDGGDIFICEKKEVDEQQGEDISVYGSQYSYSRFYYYFYEISVLSVNPDGTLDWHKMVKKEQISMNDDGYYSSFGCQVLNNKLYFIYNDMSRKSSNVLLYEVNPNGQGESEIFLRASDLDGHAIPKEAVQVSSKELLIPVIKLREGFTILKVAS